MEPTTKAESQLAETARSGAEADCRDLSGEDANIRPQFLRALMLGLATDKAGGEPIRPPGAVRLARATITGDLELSLLGSSDAPLPGLILRGCHIEGKVDLAGARLGEVELRFCHLKAFHAPRAHVDGHLMLDGLKMPDRAAIEIDDIVVAHCFSIQDCKAAPKTEDASRAEEGTTAGRNLRLGPITMHNASIGGDLYIRGLVCKGRENAIDARDVIVTRGADLIGTDTIGAVSFYGAKVGGQFRVSGAKLVGQLNGAAFDLAWASVGSLVFSAAYNKPVKITGAFHAFGLTAPGGVVIQTESGQPAPRCLELDGVLDFRKLKAGLFLLTEASIRPSSDANRFCEAIFGDSVLCLSHAEIVGVLKIRLDDTSKDRRDKRPHDGDPSRGVVDLRGARVRALDDDGGGGWGDWPKQNTQNKDGRIAEGVALLLDGFVYERIEIDGSSVPPKLPKKGRKIRRWFLDMSKSDWALIERRLAFIDRMYHGEKTTPDKFFPQPYRGLAKTLRDTGHGFAARPILFAMEKEALDGAPRDKHGRIFWKLWHIAFGFGFSSLHAARTLLFLLAVGTSGFWIAENYETPCGYFTALCRSVAAGHPVFPDEITTPSWSPSPPSAVPMPPVTCNLAYADGAPVSYECVDSKGNLLKIAAHPVALRKIFAIEKVPYEWAPACEARPWIYAIDVMVPFLDLKDEASCGFLHEAPWYWHFFRALCAIVGAVAIPLAALTFTGLLRRE